MRRTGTRYYVFTESEDLGTFTTAAKMRKLLRRCGRPVYVEKIRQCVDGARLVGSWLLVGPKRERLKFRERWF